MNVTKTKAEVLAGVQESVGSIFTKEDVIKIINSIKEEEGGGTISKDKLVGILSDIDFDSYIEKEITIDSGDLNFSFDTNERGNGITITAEVDESTVEDAVTVEISSVDVHGLADEILSGLED
jgi:hypothetical protein